MGKGILNSLFALAVASPVLALAQGVTADKILVGQAAVFSGPAAQLGIQMRNGIKAYFDAVNEKGGVHGRKLELVTEDDQYEPKVAPVATKKLIDEHKVFALLGYVGTPTGVAHLPVVTQAKVPLVGMFTGAEVLREPLNRYVFHVRASYYDETEKIVEQVVSTGGKKISVFYQNDAYGEAGRKGTELALTKRGMKIHSTGTVERNTVKVEEAVKAIHASQPDAVVMVSAYTSIAAFVRTMQKAGSAATFYNVSFVGSKALADALGKDGVGVAIAGGAVPVGNRPAGGQGVPGGIEEGGLHRLQLQRDGGFPHRQGDGRGPAARGPRPEPREIRRHDGKDAGRGPGRLLRHVFAQEPCRVQVRGPDDHQPRRKIPALRRT
jgi:branched-chain amino acid transport system substrate-binding protein